MHLNVMYAYILYMCNFKIKQWYNISVWLSYSPWVLFYRLDTRYWNEV